MRYWDSKNQRTESGRPRSRASHRSIASGGSLREYPFLRKFYRHQAVISGGLQKFLFFLFISILLYAFVFGDGGAIQIFALKRQKASLEKDVAVLEADIERLKNEIERLKTDPFAIEKLGRERYGYIYPGDRVYKIIPPIEHK